MLAGEISKFTFARIDCKFSTSSEKNTGQYTMYRNTGDGGDLKLAVL